jgi:hypothetical protein
LAEKRKMLIMALAGGLVRSAGSPSGGAGASGPPIFLIIFIDPPIFKSLYMSADFLKFLCIRRFLKVLFIYCSADF